MPALFSLQPGKDVHGVQCRTSIPTRMALVKAKVKLQGTVSIRYEDENSPS